MPKPAKKVFLSKKQIGERLKALREQRGYSQGKLAKMLGSHPQNISQIERGIRGVTVQQLVKLARTLQVSTDDILGEARHVTAQLQLRNGDRRFLRRLRRIQELPPLQRKALLKLLDGALGLGTAADAGP